MFLVGAGCGAGAPLVGWSLGAFWFGFRGGGWGEGWVLFLFGDRAVTGVFTYTPRCAFPFAIVGFGVGVGVRVRVRVRVDIEVVMESWTRHPEETALWPP